MLFIQPYDFCLLSLHFRIALYSWFNELNDHDHLDTFNRFRTYRQLSQFDGDGENCSICMLHFHVERRAAMISWSNARMISCSATAAAFQLYIFRDNKAGKLEIIWRDLEGYSAIDIDINGLPSPISYSVVVEMSSFVHELCYTVQTRSFWKSVIGIPYKLICCVPTKNNLRELLANVSSLDRCCA